ncbi:phage tail protein [Lampropedia cohaerens]|uniref:phage tail protein n=1 Tax=Lampropedia cohaerens TaxID=1610491 RepID=UPI0018D203A8|nr:Ig-like domain-containing protein [Lampropedia cohaerens]
MRENLATFQTLSVSGDGTLKASGAGAANLIELTKHVANPIATGGQPVVWVRMTFPDLTFTFFAILSNLSRSAPFDDVVTYSFEASATASDYGLIVEDTPSVVTPTSVTVTPATVSITEGATQALTATVGPAGAPQAVTYTSASNAVATVSAAGVVTGVAAGTTTITVRSATAPNVTATVSVTVTEP